MTQFGEIKRIFGLGIIFGGILFFARGSWAAVKNAVSCNASDMRAGINAASPGDIVVVPAGT